MHERRPDWLKARAPGSPNYIRLKGLVKQLQLHTVCESAICPNVGECWGHGTATFMILGDVCTRRCGFCAITTGRPMMVDWGEPMRVAEAVKALGLRHAVITSVARDELRDGGAAIFAATIRAIRRLCLGTSVEVLIPDFKGDPEALRCVMEARPDILNHNIETVERLSPLVRPQARYHRSLELLKRAKGYGTSLTKSGVMLGVGETIEEVEQSMADLREVGCDILTIGQYLRPSQDHLPVVTYHPPEEFLRLKNIGLSMGFTHVESGPLVRSSYHAEDQVPVS
ncbi:MAG: lipoyl synthase [Candidatus Latescibacteria bacterium]|nr:lipoyl synthase [Candidatus Latescibacterota bacterium]